MNKKKIETLLYSTLGVVIMFGIVLAVNLIVGVVRARIDMTEDKLYTLSDGTRRILARIDAPVTVRFYFSRSEPQMPSGLKTYAKEVEDLLDEFRRAASGKLIIRKFDPKPDSDAEDMARLDGIEPQMLPSGDQFYLGLAVSLDPAKVALPYLAPERAQLLEYDVARAIAQVLSTNKPVIGVMSPLPVFGQPANPMMMRAGQRGQDPWVFITELKRDFEVREVPMDTEKIDDDIQLLVVVHPKDIKETTQYAIDQFVLRGGKLLAMLDAFCLADESARNPSMGFNMGSSSNLDKLLKAWGISFDTSKVAADLNFARRLRGPGGQAQLMPAFLFVDKRGIDQNDVATSLVDEILLPLAGTFSGTPAEGLEQTILMQTTDEAQLVDGFLAQMGSQKIVDEFKPEGKAYPLAVRLKGKFKTAFPDGKPKSGDEDEKDKDKKASPSAEQLKESKQEGVVVLIGDADWVYDAFCARIQSIFGQRIIIPQFGNLTLAQSLVEQLAGDSDLIGVRSRATVSRPFTVVREMQKEANLKFQAEIKKLEEEKAEAERRLNELQAQKKDIGQRFILTPEQQAEIEKFRKKQAEAARKLKEVRKNLRKEIDSLQNRLKWMNIAAMPALVTVLGLVLAGIRKQRTKAR